MSFSFAQVKRDARRAVHDTFAVSAEYRDDSMVDPVPLRVRFHTQRVSPFGDLNGQGFADVIENADRVVFDLEALAALPVVPCRGGVLVFPDYGLTLVLDQREAVSGPINETWTVTRT